MHIFQIAFIAWYDIMEKAYQSLYTIQCTGKEPNQVGRTDFLYMWNASRQGYKSMLVLKEDLVSYAWLQAGSNRAGERVTGFLQRWVALFGSKDWLVFGLGRHFTALFMPEVNNRPCAHICFTQLIFYERWTNGTALLACRESSWHWKAIFVERKLDQNALLSHHWLLAVRF